MAGKREHKKRGKRLWGVAMLLAVLVILLAPHGTAGVAADSPAAPETPAAQMTVVEDAFAVEAAVPLENLTVSGEIAEPEEPTQPAAAPETPWAPVAEGDAVEDTYFSDVVFLGDSRTEGFHLYSGLTEGASLYAVGATVESVFSKNVWKTDEGEKIPLLDALAQTACEKVYVMLGVNELGWAGVETFHDQYARVVDRIREDHPDAEVVLQSLLPVSAKQEEKKTYVNNNRILAYNDAVRRLAQEKSCPYVNVAEVVTGEDGCLKPELTFDGVHLNTAGCRIWLEYLRTHTA